MEKIIVDPEVKKFINSLDEDTAIKVVWTIDLLENLGYLLRLPYCKKILKNIFELRIGGKVKVRLFYLFHKQQIIIIHGFIKKTPKLPKNELKTLTNKIKNLDLT
jgi:phage-related protein